MSRSERSSRLPLLLLSIASWAGLAVAYWLWVRTEAGQKLDQAAYDGRPRGRAHDAAGELLATIDVISLAIAIGLLMLIALLRHREVLALLAGTVVVGSVLITEFLKHFALERPNLLGPAEAVYGNSFPSGHTTIAFSIGVAAILVAPPRLRRAVIAIALLYGVCIGIATIAAGWHRPSDVVGGFLVVAGWTALVTLIATSLDPDTFSSDRSGMQPAVIKRYVAIGVAVALVGAFVAVCIAVASDLGRLRLTALDAQFVLAAAVVAGSAAVILAALVNALRDALPAPTSTASG